VLCALPAQAHHSFAAIYDSAQEATLEGTVTEFAFVNPHPLLFIAVIQGAQTQTWRLEMDNRSELAEIGIAADTFEPGDRVVVTGSPGRTQVRILYLRLLIRPADGLRYQQIGSTPSIIFPSAQSR
jgi:hypothetical protein